MVTSAGGTKVSASDGSCAGSVGVQVKTATTTSHVVYAYQEVVITGSGMKSYKVWH